MSEALAARAARWRSAVPVLLTAMAAVPFVLDLDAQWLKVDDFSMIAMFRSRPLGELVLDILLTRTTPHVRFAFLEHLLLIPFFRGLALHRWAVNAVFLSGVAALIASAALAASAVRPRSRLVWAAAFAVMLPVVWSARAWVTLEFKTALYLPYSFALGAALVAWSWRVGTAPQRPGRAVTAAWIVLAVASFHMAEVTLAAVFLAGLGLVLRDALKPAALAFVTAWPLLFWGANKLIVPRPTNLLGEGHPGALAAGITDTVWHATHTFARLSAALSVVLVVAVGAAVARGVRRSLPELLWILALPSAGVLLTLLNMMTSYGAGFARYMSERHAFYVELSLAAGIAIGVAWIATEVIPPRAGAALAVAVIGAAGVASIHRLEGLSRAAQLRRVELARAFAVEDAIRRVRGRDTPMIVLVSDWPDGWVGRIYSDPTFLSERWSRADYGKVRACAFDRCGPLEFVVNTATIRTPLDGAQRRALCDRASTSRVLAVEATGIVEERPPADADTCSAWLVSRGFVDAPRSGALGARTGAP